MAAMTDSERNAIVRRFQEEYTGALCKFAMSRTKDADETEDLLQRLWIRVIEKLHTLRDFNNPFPWLIRVLERVLINEGKRSKAERRREDAVARQKEMDQSHKERQVAGEEDEAGRPTNEMIEELSEGLPEKQKIAFKLKHSAGLSPEEIAAKMGTTEGSVRGLLHRAAASIRNESPILLGLRKKSRDALPLAHFDDPILPKISVRGPDYTKVAHLSDHQKELLGFLGKQGIKAVERGDGFSYLHVGTSFVRNFPNENVPEERILKALGLYLQGEGNRLLPVIYEGEHDPKTYFDLAFAQYQQAVALDPSPRNLRGLGKAFQMKGDLREAYGHFTRVIDTVSTGKALNPRSPSAPLNRHELLRALRHRIDLEIDLRFKRGTGRAENSKNDKLVDDLKRCIAYHKEFLPAFSRSNRNWTNYEAFMGYSFLTIAACYLPEAGDPLVLLRQALASKTSTMAARKRGEPGFRSATEQDFQNVRWALSGLDQYIHDLGRRSLVDVLPHYDALNHCIKEKNARRLLASVTAFIQVLPISPD